MIPFYSKRNQVYPTLYEGRAAVEKHFCSMGDWQLEAELYQTLAGRLPLPELLLAQPGMLVTTYCPFPTLLQVLKMQDARAHCSPAPWQALAAWLRACHALCGMLPLEGNLRNFLWDEARQVVLGLDLESLRPCSLEAAGSRLIAGLMTYALPNTVVKEQAAQLLQTELDIPAQQREEAWRWMQARRSSGASRPVSGILLAGGQSRRMGRDKAGLPLLGRTFLQIQVEKLRALGIQEILLSGEPGEFDKTGGTDLPPGTVWVPDVFPGRGPLGGLHACLGAARNSSCIVLTVDTPLVPCAAMAHLRRAHRGGITVLCHSGREEPLLSVMDCSVDAAILPLLSGQTSHSTSVRALKETVPWNRWVYTGPEEFLRNCNTPKDYEAMVWLAGRYTEAFSAQSNQNIL